MTDPDPVPSTTIADRLRVAGPVRLFIGLVGVLVLFGPVVMWGLGARAGVIENRPFAAKPTLSQGFEFSDQFTAFFTDRLPIREDAVDVRRRVSQELFGEAPQAAATGGPVGAGSGVSGGTRYVEDRAQQVLPGADGWLYFGDDFVRACRPEQPVGTALTQIRRLSDALRAAGKNAAIAIVPDKSTIETQRLPEDLPERSCAADARKARYDGMAALRRPDVLDLRGALQRLQREVRGPVYVPTDTHVTTRGSAEYVRSVVAALDPEAARTARLVDQQEPFVYTGDLSVIQGQPQQVSEPTLLFDKPGVRKRPSEDVAPITGFPVTRLRATGTRRAPVVPGRTVWYGDSFTQRALPNIAAFFRDVWRVPELSNVGAAKEPEVAVDFLIDQIRQSQNVVLETVERNAFGRVGGSILNPEVVDRMVAELAKDPGVRSPGRP